MIHLTSVLLTAAFAASPIAQDPGPTVRLGESRVPVHSRATGPGEAPYGIWAAGDAYKASFHDGMTFVPALGASYPVNQPWSWRTRSIRIGETELVTLHTTGQPRCEAFRVEYDLGAAIEAYDVRDDGLEQSFLITSRPPGNGDLVVVGDVTSALTAATREAAFAALVFCDASGTGIVGYGRAVAIDATGRRFPMRTAHAAGEVRLSLDAASVAAASFPLCIDPLLGNQLQYVAQGNAVGAGAVDVAIEDEHPSTNQMVVRTWPFSATDLDVRASIGDVATSAATTVFADLSSTSASDHAHAAYVAGGNAWVIVYQSLDLATNVMRLRAHQHGGGSTAFGSSVSTASTPGGSAWRPVVGGTAANSSGTHALVAFQFEPGATTFAQTATSQVHAVRFETTALGGMFNLPFVVRATANVDHERPAINRTADGGIGFPWLVVDQEFDNTIAADDWDLVGVLVYVDGTTSSNQWVSDLNGMHKLGPVVDGRHGRFCVAFSTCATTWGKVANVWGNDIRVERLDWTTGSPLPSPAGDRQPVALFAAHPNRTYETGGIAYDGDSRSHWFVGTHFDSGSARELRAFGVGYRGERAGTPQTLMVASPTSISTCAVAHSERTATTNFAWTAFENGATATAYTRAGTSSPPVAVLSSGSACSATTIEWTGPAQQNPWRNQLSGTDLAALTAAGAPANALHVVLVGSASTLPVPIVHPLVLPGCELLVPASGPDYLGTLPLGVGTATAWNLPIPEFWVTALTFQDWILDPATGMLSASHRLRVPFAFL